MFSEGRSSCKNLYNTDTIIKKIVMVMIIDDIRSRNNNDTITVRLFPVIGLIRLCGASKNKNTLVCIEERANRGIIVLCVSVDGCYMQSAVYQHPIRYPDNVSECRFTCLNNLCHCDKKIADVCEPII